MATDVIGERKRGSALRETKVVRGPLGQGKS